MTPGAPVAPGLRSVLEHSRELGFLGPGPVETHVDHAHGFARAWTATEHPRAILDLGSGGGVPGLVLATTVWPDARWVLLDAGLRRCAFLLEAIEELGIEDRVQVHRARAEDAGREPHLRGAHDLVVSRGFGPPSVTVEVAAPLLAVGGLLVVSEPPGGRPDRWDAGAMRKLGLRPVPAEPTDGPAFAVFRQAERCPERYPRRVGIPAKRPLF